MHHPKRRTQLPAEAVHGSTASCNSQAEDVDRIPGGSALQESHSPGSDHMQHDSLQPVSSPLAQTVASAQEPVCGLILDGGDQDDCIEFDGMTFTVNQLRELLALGRDYLRGTGEEDLHDTSAGQMTAEMLQRNLSTKVYHTRAQGSSHEHSRQAPAHEHTRTAGIHNHRHRITHMQRHR